MALRCSRSVAKEQSPADYLPMVERLREVLGDYVQSNAALTPYVRNNPA